jgi:6-phosphogluconate dehydrogenase
MLGYRDQDGQTPLDYMLDRAGQKGTGRWTAETALSVGQPLTLIGGAVFARFLSALKDERITASETLTGPRGEFEGDRQGPVDEIRQGLYASKIVSYAQSYQLMRAVAHEHDWSLEYGGIALLWRAGCIIRSVFLERIRAAFERAAAAGQPAAGPARLLWRAYLQTRRPSRGVPHELDIELGEKYRWI